MKPEIVALFNDLAEDAETNQGENLYLGRHALGYRGDPKEFRYSDLYGQLLPGAKYDRLVEHIDEYSKTSHDRLRRKLTAKEVAWMQREAKKLYESERAYVAGRIAEKKSAAQLDADIAETLRRRKTRG